MSSIIKVNTIQDTDGNNIINESGNVITIGASGDTITVPAGATVSGFTSAGIDDNATSVAITIDSAEKVGIGITSPSQPLHVFSSGNDIARIETNQTEGRLSLKDATGDAVLKFRNDYRFTNSSGELARLNSSGNFGIGTTAPINKLHVFNTDHTQLCLEGERPTMFLKETNGNANENFQFRVDGGNLQLQSQNDAQSNASTRLLITQSGNVGIGTSSPSTILDIRSASPVISTVDTGDSNAVAQIDGNAGWLQLKADNNNTLSGTNITFSVDGSEKARLDANGSLFISKTSNTIADDGHAFTDSFASHTVSNNPPLYLNRKSSDGTILEFRKDDTAVGILGSEGGDSLFITSGDTGLKFSGGSDAIIPATTAGAARDNAIDLGSSGARYKDLYLSSGVFLGGTGTANKLTDYEEGTWTPIIKFGGGTTGISATQVGAYTKIGNLVTLQIFIEFSNKGSSTGAATISGIPFTIATLTNSWSGVGTAPLVWHNMASSLVQAGVTVNRSSQLLNLFGHTASNGNGTNQALTNTDFANNSYFGITAAYLST